ncbi:MAG: hypothetical protein ACRDYV_18290 [Acidimicrobiia bacterium]
MSRASTTMNTCSTRKTSAKSSKLSSTTFEVAASGWTDATPSRPNSSSCTSSMS